MISSISSTESPSTSNINESLKHAIHYPVASLPGIRRQGSTLLPPRPLSRYNNPLKLIIMLLHTLMSLVPTDKVELALFSPASDYACCHQHGSLPKTGSFAVRRL